jgi:hypothetical protein
MYDKIKYVVINEGKAIKLWRQKIFHGNKIYQIFIELLLITEYNVKNLLNLGVFFPQDFNEVFCHKDNHCVEVLKNF